MLAIKLIVVEWLARLMCNRWMQVRREDEPHQRLPLLNKHVTFMANYGWLHERIRASFRDRTTINLHKSTIRALWQIAFI